MKRQVSLPLVIVACLIAFGAGAGAGILGWLWFWGGNETPSESVENVAPQLSLGGSTGSGLSLGSTPEPEPTETSMLPVFAKPQTPYRAQQVTPEPEATPEPMPIDISRGLYRINPEASRVLFILQEDLRGQRIDVIGTTNQVAGDMILDFAEPTASVVGQIVVNARTLVTDSSQRNQVIRSQVLRSAQDAYEFITFTPTRLDGLDDLTVLTNTPVTAQITGDLKIVDTTRSVTFDAELTILDDLSLTGTASVTVRWADFGLRIPSVPSVSNITDDVTLTIEFSADLIDSESGAAANDVGYNRGLFRIDPEQSEVRFVLQEDLAGQRVNVIGITNQVGGDLIVDVTNPAASQVGQVVINARTLATDNSFRNQAIRSEILRSGQDAYEFITFTPTAINGLEGATVAVGTPIEFEITGDLKIVDTTRSVTFVTTGALTDAQTLTGSASVTVLWADFGLRIPRVPGVSNITDEVTLEIDFTAALVDSE